MTPVTLGAAASFTHIVRLLSEAWDSAVEEAQDYATMLRYVHSSTVSNFRCKKLGTVLCLVLLFAF